MLTNDSEAVKHDLDFTAIRRRRRGVALAIIGLCFAVIAAAQLLAPVVDRRVMNIDNHVINITTYIAAAVAVLTALVWSLRRPGVSAIQRYAPTTLAVLLVAAFLLVFRFEGFTGALEPVFGLRFAAEADLPSDMSGRADQFDLGGNSYPGFLGPGRDGVIAERDFSTSWNENPPRVRWRQPIGEGWSGFAIAGSFGVTLEQRGGEEWISCYDLADGRLLWHHAESGRHSNVMGGVGPRSTPTIRDGKVYAQTALGRVVCLDGTSGELLWRVDLFRRGGLGQATAEDAVTWGRAGSPLLVDDLVVVPFGGQADPTASTQGPGLASLIAFDSETGEERWVGGDTQISYASPVLATLDGQRQIVSVNESNVTGHVVETGAVLWEADWAGSSNTGANCSTPVIYQDDGVLVSKGYGRGAKLLRIADDPQSDRQTATVDWRNRRVLKTKFTNAVVDGSFAYGLSDGYLECVDMTDGSRKWRQGRSSRYGQGQVLRIDGVLLVQAEMGELALVACNPEAFEELVRIPALDDKTWNYPAVAGMTLLVRNHEEAIAYDLPPREAE